MTDPAHPAPASDGRGESANERFDRNWEEILQELRVTQTGTQIISGFLLAIAFQQRFSQLNDRQVTTYLALVILAASATAVGLAPVSLHRTLFRRHQKERVVVIGDRLLRVTLLLVALLTGGVVMFIFDVVTSLLAGIIVGTVIFALLLFVLVVLPRSARHRIPSQ